MQRFACFPPSGLFRGFCLDFLSAPPAPMSPFEDIPVLEIFLGILGFGLSIMFCTTFCRVCSRMREEQIEREVWRRSEQDGRPPSIYFIPFPGSVSSQQDGEDVRAPRYSQELHTPPHYSTVFSGPPPSYTELGVKPEDLPPAYTEQSVPAFPMAPQPHTDTVQSQARSQAPSRDPLQLARAEVIEDSRLLH